MILQLNRLDVSLMPKITVIGNLLSYKGSEPVFDNMKNVASQIIKEIIIADESQKGMQN